jgi:hypothetical protein
MSSIHDRRTRAYDSHEDGAGQPLDGNSRSHRFTTVAGRRPDASSNARSSSTRTGMPSGMIGRRWTPQDSHPPDEKKINSMPRTYIRDRRKCNTVAAGHRRCDVLSRHDIKAERRQ